jgi:nicotinamidase-related amidase
MPLTQLDTTAALIVIDVQKGIVGMPTVHPTSEIIARSAQLARVFRERGLPVRSRQRDSCGSGPDRRRRHHLSFPPDFAEPIPELEQHPDDYVVSKQRVGAFIGTPWMKSCVIAA